MKTFYVDISNPINTLKELHSLVNNYSSDYRSLIINRTLGNELPKHISTLENLK